MTGPPRLGRRNPQVVRSQVAFEVGLSAYAAIGALLLLRFALLALGVSDRVWAGRIIYDATGPIIWPLTLPPGAARSLLGQAGLPEMTAVAVVALIPLAMVARDRRQRETR